MTLAIGWFFAGLLPVIGLIHVGSASHADRYTYLPTLGLSILVAVVVCQFLDEIKTARLPCGFAVLGLAGICLIEGLIALEYIGVWKNSGTLFEHAARVTRNNSMAHTNAGGYYIRMPGEKERVAFHYQKALEYERSPKVLGNLALWLMMNRGDEYLEQAGALAAEGIAKPCRNDDYVVWDAMGYYLLRKEHYAEGEELLRKSVAVFPWNPVTWEWLATCCFKQQKYAEAVEAIKGALKIDPGNLRYQAMLKDAVRRAHAR